MHAEVHHRGSMKTDPSSKMKETSNLYVFRNTQVLINLRLAIKYFYSGGPLVSSTVPPMRSTVIPAAGQAAQV